ncbi:FAD dependent oxidoreductase [Roridomyces roridus]|uniref:FAD dependent oxidoreductase n=1 Tax=Roridomyces roridus TaxID=1738132 RepID=A0AAD7FB82_9AGAR|nr:FAD dependent oxidoreductase [Roridomyces roridus]
MDALPGYPRPKPCLSFWLMGTRNSPLIGHHTTLPEHADVTIIGSGFSGAAIAYFLLTGHNPPKYVVLLEAREACDGATARNGGHCRPDAFSDYGHYKKDFGKEQAMKIIQNEMDTLDLMTEIVKKEGIDCEFWRGFSYAVPADQPSADAFAALYQEFVDDGGKVERIVERVLDPEAARQATRCPIAYATHTAVRAVCSNSGGSWNVQTDRGVVRKGKVREQDGLFGGRRGAVSLDKLLGNTNDTETYLELSAALKKALPAFFEGWDEQVEGRVSCMCIMGYPTEGIPYVGELHDKPGAFICAGHHVHEMARIMTCAKGLAEMIMM